ncbi:LysR family transcriptional regulator [Aliivibrio salmonicida]|uniref:HTH-type transcriptional regulator, LysR family n=1 Tax=Aliivibrio salmonicida (strain LFI1238) TaxID=316275 RepID=B6EQD8_ALISL|nr:LysR family transcriptional regulator [Aliivibrio salmonicida]CAQ80910.1 HTH-type transcriptional regulator, LysR family [Aliivibrio salmonicida LFI1238]
MDLNSLNIFVNVVQHGSFSAASKIMNIPVATVSRRVSELENQLDQQLLIRTTRKLSVTHVGQLLYQRASSGLNEIFDAEQAINEEQEDLKGQLRISIPPALYVFDDMFHQFNNTYPLIQLDIFSTVRKTDFIDDDVDIVIRVGKVNYQSAIARHLGKYRHVMVCSQKFINKYGIPKDPTALANLPIAAWRFGHGPITWQLGEHCIEITPKFSSSDYVHSLSAIRTGEMLGELPPMLANPLLRSGEFVEVLAEYPLPEVDLHIIYPSRKHLSRLSKVFIDDFIQFCRTHQKGDSLFNISL